MRIGASKDDEDEGGVTHLIVDGVAGAGGKVAGARRDCVSANIEGGKFGGIRKCKFSSLHNIN